MALFPVLIALLTAGPLSVLAILLNSIEHVGCYVSCTGPYIYIFKLNFLQRALTCV